MIHRLRVEGFDDDPGDLRRFIDTITDHAWIAGIYEGLIPRAMTTTEEVYPRRKPEEAITLGDSTFWADFTGRKNVQFEMLGNDLHVPMHPKPQLAEADGVEREYLVQRRLPTGELVDVTDGVIVLERRRPPEGRDGIVTARTREHWDALRACLPEEFSGKLVGGFRSYGESPVPMTGPNGGTTLG
jgi:hypothetical protein